MGKPQITRRGVLNTMVGLTVVTGLAGFGLPPKREFVGLPEIEAYNSSLVATGKIKNFDLTARLTQIDLGGTIAQSWTYGDVLPGKMIRVNKGDRVKVAFNNELPVSTSVHWHGLAIRNDMDGVPGVTTPEVAPGEYFNFDFITPDAGTHWFHPHSGTQLDRGLYAPFIVDDPEEKSEYEREWIIIVDDWSDGVGKDPDEILAELEKGDSTQSDGMDHMDMGGMNSGDVIYPMYLINGRPSNDPEIFLAKPGERIRLRIINAAADTIFDCALAQHMMEVTHTDGYPVKSLKTALIQIGMGERYDVIITVKDGVFPFVAQAVGKTPMARALIRTGSGRAPAANFNPSELNAIPLSVQSLEATEEARLPSKRPDRIQNLVLTGTMNPYIWNINGRTYADTEPLTISLNEMGRLRIRNMTMMPHPMHLHGHTFQLGSAGGSGARKDTVLLPSMGGIDVDFAANNPGRWMIHCHNAYHAEAGMMTRLEYTV